MSERAQTLNEEIANAITHGIGVLFGLVFLPIVVVKAWNGGWADVLSAVAFSVGMLMVYTSSTLYHAVRSPKWKDILQIGDHISIYYLIAGSYTPLVIRYLSAEGAIAFLSVMWGMALFGTVFKLFFTRRFPLLSVSIYLFMGWMISFIAGPLIKQVPADLLAWIVAGGLSYTSGVFFYVKSHRKYFHTIWHVCVFMGTVCHAVFVYQLYQ